MHATDPRRQLLLDWLENDVGQAVDDLRPASSDASFRRYFRVFSGSETHIAMDAPPPRENVRPFIAVADRLSRVGVQTPAILASDVERGFLLLSDFGNCSYLDALTPQTAPALYGDALDTLLSLQRGVPTEGSDLPRYDERLLLTELGVFREWFLAQWLELSLSEAEQQVLASAERVLVDSALEQPRVCVHRDYHCRNLMVTERANPGVLDFQDAVIGPITYDLASLLRDCYIAWPEPQVYAWMDAYRDRLVTAGLLSGEQVGRFRRWFDLMGLQRHLKAVGIFARLKMRDDKPGYLKDIPRTLGYVTAVGQQYPELADFIALLDRRVWPRLTAESRA